MAAGLGAECAVQAANATGLVGVIVQGRKNRLGWVLGTVSEGAWATYAWLAHVPGLYPWCGIWAAFYGWNYLKWRRKP